MEESLMVEAFKEVNLLASWILRQRKNPLRNGIVLSSKPKQGKEESPREIRPTRGSKIPSDGLKTTDSKRKNPVVHKGKNQPEKRTKGIQPVIDWNENHDCLSGPLEKLLLWCNELEEKQLKAIVEETEEIHSAMAELFLKIAQRLIDILDCDSAPETVKKTVRNILSLKEKYDNESSSGESPPPYTVLDCASAPESVKKGVRNVLSLKEKYDDESNTGESPPPHRYFDDPKDIMSRKEKYDNESNIEESFLPYTYFDDPADIMESLRINVSHLYELGPTITALLVDFRDRERPPKRKKSLPVAQISPNQSDLITTPQTSLSQRDLKPDTAKSSPLPPSTHKHSHKDLEGPAPTYVRPARTPQGPAISFITVLPVLERTSRQSLNEFQSGRIPTGRRVQQTTRYTTHEPSRRDHNKKDFLNPKRK